MSYKSDLQQNNADLQSILDGVNALPDAGSGGGASVETCTVNVVYGNRDIYLGYTSYTDGEGIVPTWTQIPEPCSIKVLKNSIIICKSNITIAPMDDIEDYLSLYTTAGQVLEANAYNISTSTYTCISIIKITSDGILEPSVT